MRKTGMHGDHLLCFQNKSYNNIRSTERKAQMHDNKGKNSDQNLPFIMFSVRPYGQWE